MPSEVAIANRALTWIGDKTITDFNENTNQARTIATVYQQCRDDLVADYPWTFAMKRALLPALAEAPAYQYNVQYQLPDDCFRVWEVNNGWAENDLYAWGWSGGNIPGGVPAGYNPYNISDYMIEGRVLLTNIRAPLPIRYVSIVEDSTQFPPLFVSTLACRLAIESCVRVTGSSAGIPDLEARQQTYIRRAKKSDAMQKPPQMMRDSTWIAAQFRG